MVSDDRIKQILEAYYMQRDEQGLDIETIKRYERHAKKRFPEWQAAMETYRQLQEHYSYDEIQQIISGGEHRNIPSRTKQINFDGQHIRFAFVTDTHFGASCFDEAVWHNFVEEVKKNDVDFVVHTGDVVEGLNSKRMDMCFDLTHIGYDPQKKYAEELLSELNDIPLYCVSGNHDRWFSHSVNANIVENICDDLSKDGMNVQFLGNDTGDLVIDTPEHVVNIRLWHGEDSSSYATSYRVQKLIESMPHTHRPDILLCGHTHKACYLFEQNVHAVSGGALCGQSNWMKSKRLANHTGFWIIDMLVNERGVARFTPTFYPMYD